MEYRPDIKTTDQLWDNLKEIIERNNRNKINGILSDTEFSQVKREISKLDTPYKAGQFLYGMNGISEIDITLDDGRDIGQYSSLLEDAILSIIYVKNESEIDSFLSCKEMSFLSESIEGLDDFELISFLVIKDRE